MHPLLLAVVIAQVTPLPSAPPLKTIITVKSTPLCQTLTGTVFDTISGLQSNDRIVESTKPVLIDFGKAWVDNSIAGHQFDQLQIRQVLAPADVHNQDNPAMILDVRKLARRAEAIVHNLAVIDALLADPQRFPTPPKTDQDVQALKLRAELQAVANQQRQVLNEIYGLADTFDLQDLIAHGDSTQHVLDRKFKDQLVAVSVGDQDVSFQDILRGPATTGRPQDPTVDTDPAISQKATGVSANNPIGRFYLGIEANQVATARAEDTLTQTVLDVTNQCKP